MQSQPTKREIINELVFDTFMQTYLQLFKFESGKQKENEIKNKCKLLTKEIMKQINDGPVH
jgi:hypothetical protein